MPNRTETGAAKTEFEQLNDNGTKGVALQIPVDIRIGLALVAKHVYCVDNGDECYDIPGFEMLTESELTPILTSTRENIQETSLDKKNVKSVGKIGKSDEEKYKLAHKDHNKYGVRTFNLDSEDPDVEIWIQELRFRNDNGKKYCGILGPSGFKAAIYKKKNSPKYSQCDLSKLECQLGNLKDCLPKYIVAFAGSDNIFNTKSFDYDKNTLDDWLLTNINQGLGIWLTYSKQYKIAYNLGKFLKNKGFDVMSVGHSLGGGISSAFSVGAECKAMNFNAAGLHRGALAQYMSYPQKSFFGRLFNMKPLFVGRKNENYQRVLRQENNVQVYSSTTDMLTTSQNHIAGVTTYTNDVPTFILNYIGGIIHTNAYFAPLTLAATAVTSTLRILPIIGQSVMTDPLPPTTYGNLILIKTENSKWAQKEQNLLSTKPDYSIANSSELIFSSERWIGHDMSMIIDGLINVIHDVNNLAMSFQASKSFYRGILRKICCDGNKYTLNGIPAKAGCTKCGSICFWYRLATWNNKCVYFSLSETIAEDVNRQPTNVDGKEYNLSPSHNLKNTDFHNIKHNDEVTIELTDCELDSSLNGIAKQRAAFERERKRELEGKNDDVKEEPVNKDTLKKRLKQYGKKH